MQRSITKQKGFTVVELIGGIGSLAFIGGIGYIVVHFVAKFW
jgi:hypothetical protein